MEKRNGAHGRGRHECARGTGVPGERGVELPPAVRVRGEERVENGGGVELRTRCEVEIIK